MTWKKNDGDFVDPPLGTHIARCVGIIDLGTRKSEYKGKTNIRRESLIRWELPTELMDTGESAGKPFVVSKFYTASLSDKANLRADLVNWRGKEFTPEELAGFDERNLLDKVCLLTIIKNAETGKVKVAGVMGRPKGMEVPPRVNELVYFSLDPEAFDRAVFDKLSDGIKNIIIVSPEWAELNGKKAPATSKTVDDFDDDIPF